MCSSKCCISFGPSDEFTIHDCSLESATLRPSSVSFLFRCAFLRCLFSNAFQSNVLFFDVFFFLRDVFSQCRFLRCALFNILRLEFVGLFTRSGFHCCVCRMPVRRQFHLQAARREDTQPGPSHNLVPHARYQTRQDSSTLCPWSKST